MSSAAVERTIVSTPVVRHAAATPWTPLAPGIEMQIFHADPATGYWTTKIHMLAGSTLPPHRHVGASEFFILEGQGTHHEAGDFDVGTYAFEPQGSLHSAVHAERDIVLYMVSYGSGVFLSKGATRTLYEGNASYFARQMNLPAAMRALKRLLFIRMWNAFASKTPPRVDRANEASGESMMRATRELAYRPVDDASSMRVRALHVLDWPSVWSAMIRIPKGSHLPERENFGAAEYLVIAGEGRMVDGTRFRAGDYLREGAGVKPKIRAEADMEVFTTNHGRTVFRLRSHDRQWCADRQSIQALLRYAA